MFFCFSILLRPLRLVSPPHMGVLGPSLGNTVIRKSHMDHMREPSWFFVTSYA